MGAENAMYQIEANQAYNHAQMENNLHYIQAEQALHHAQVENAINNEQAFIYAKEEAALANAQKQVAMNYVVAQEMRPHYYG
ncbi:unnamed protein product [Bursaphelenchus okinawaensis]|uniref:Uncharacterized protein n=1 Tax=Bursaphelenchus okinawaensis TaxID=465554 RepID=A0A811LDU8_9BILA|nr:unnamed protein product [Bursaphelenchus okinawaensis]CAG9121202.1 unnamed protein product [Bursaphelenchus okinawaensis]